MDKQGVNIPPFTYLGEKATASINEMGAMAILFLKAFLLIFRSKQLTVILQHVYHIGARSATIVTLVGLFTGMVLGLQLFHTLAKFGSEGVLGSGVALSLIRELGPVLTAIMITARAGSSMAAEIGTQRITEQIDAIFTMRIDPVGYLCSVGSRRTDRKQKEGDNHERAPDRVTLFSNHHAHCYDSCPWNISDRGYPSADRQGTGGLTQSY